MFVKFLGGQFNRGAKKNSTFGARAIFRGIAAVLLSVTFVALAAAAQEPLQFNVPYKCADGTQYVIEKCGPYGRFEMCTWREEKNGQVITTANSERTQMYGRLKPCPVQAAAKPAAPGQPPQPGQPMNPPYMKEFPSVDRVMKDMQGSDAQDTKLRQTGAFRQLKQILQDSTGDRWYHNQLTPDETRIYGEYDVAYNNLGKQTDFPLGGYGTDRKFRDDLFSRYSMTGVRAAVQKSDAAFAKKQPPPLPPTPEQAAAAAKAQAAQQSPLGIDNAATNNATSAAARRCLELDGSELECLGSGFMAGLKTMIGIDPGMNLPTSSGRAGLRLTGAFSNSGGLQLAFADDSVAIGGCGKLVPDGHGYTVGKIGSQLAIRIDNKPQPILVAMSPDGKLTGPGTVDVTGRIIIGYHNETTYKYYKSTNQMVPGSAVTTRVPDYGPATQRCTIGALPTAASTSAAGNSLLNVLDILDPTTSTDDKNKAYAKKETPPGPRLVGTYASTGGLKLGFETDDVVIDCQQAHTRQEYSVQNTPAQVVVTVQNGSTPITVTMQTNGSLSGPASVNVAGKLVTNVTDQGVQFAPTSATCSVGTMISK